MRLIDEFGNYLTTDADEFLIVEETIVPLTWFQLMVFRLLRI